MFDTGNDHDYDDSKSLATKSRAFRFDACCHFAHSSVKHSESDQRIAGRTGYSSRWRRFRSPPRLRLNCAALGNYRHRLLTAIHKANWVYPVTVEAECFETESGNPLRGAKSQEAFLTLVKQVLTSDDVRSVIESLIARSNEEKVDAADTPPSAEAAGGN